MKKSLKRLIVVSAAVATLAIGNAQADEAIAYTVEEGVDIQTIAGQYDVTVEDILITNGLETEEIEVGTVIYIPPAHAKGYYDPDSGTYVIATGDDLFAIAERFGTTAEVLQEANGLTSSEIEAGATLIVP